MAYGNKVSAILILSLIVGSSVYLYLSQSGLLGFNISQIPYDQVQRQDSRIIFMGNNTQDNFDPYSWAQMGEFFSNLSYGFYDILDVPGDIPFIPPVDPLLAPLFLPLLEAVIFNVTPADPPKYWKMTAYDYYTGSTWQKNTQLSQQLSTVSGGPQIFQIYMNISHSMRGEMLLPVLSPDPLVISDSLSIQSSSSLLSWSLLTDAYGSAILNLVFSGSGNAEVSYQTTFTPIDILSMQLNSLGYTYTDPEISAVYLQLPNSRQQYLASNPLLAYVVHIFESFAETNSVYDTALQVLGYLSSNYAFNPFASYPGGATDRVEWFLQNGNGSSMDFATAYSIILRCLNISSRMVYGFLPGEQVGDSRVIRGWNVHFWVEVFNPTSTNEDNWVQFDPTPLPGNMTELVGVDPLIGDVDYSLNVYAQNQTYWLTTRGSVFELEASLLNNSSPMPGYIIEFYDETEKYVIATAETDINGDAVCSFIYNSSARIGPHPIRASVSSLPLVRNYTLVVIDGDTNLTALFLPDPPENITRGIESLSVTGSLIDSLNGQPISGQLIRIMFDGQQVASVMTSSAGDYNFIYTPPLSAASKNTVVSAYFDGSFRFIIEGQAMSTYVPSSPVSSIPDNVVVVASTVVTTQVNETAVAPGDWIRIYGVLDFDNGTHYPNQEVQIYWRDSSGTILLSNGLTDLNGFYYYDYHVPSGAYGEVKIFSIFSSSDPYILGALTDPTIYIGEERITQLSCNPEASYRGSYITVSGILTNSSGAPIVGRAVTVQLYFTDTMQRTATYSAYTGDGGYFSVSIRLPLYFQVGSYLINCTTSSPVVIASERVYLNVISLTSIVFDVDPVFICPGEVFTLNGSIIDDLGEGLSVDLGFYLGGVFQSNVSAINGVFQIVNYTLPIGVSSSSINASIVYAGDQFYNSSNSVTLLMVFTRSLVEVNVTPSIASPGQSVQITVSASDNYGRNIYQRYVTLFLNNTPLTVVYLEHADEDVTWVVPSDMPNGPITLHGVLISNVASDYVSDTLTVQVVGLQIDSDTTIVIVAVVVVVALIFAGYVVMKRRSSGLKGPKDLTLLENVSKLRQLIASGNIREALLFMFKFLEQLLSQKYNQRRYHYQTIREYTSQVIEKTDVDSKALYELVRVVEKLKYGKEGLTNEEFLQSVGSFKTLYNQLAGEEFPSG